MLKLSPRHPIRQEVAKLATIDILDYSYDLDYSYKDYSYEYYSYKYYSYEDYSYNSDYSDDLDYSNSSKPRKTIQLERIRDLISGLYDLQKLEKIRHFYFKPWERDTLYSVNIAQLPKDQAATVHDSTLDQF